MWTWRLKENQRSEKRREEKKEGSTKVLYSKRGSAPTAEILLQSVCPCIVLIAEASTSGVKQRSRESVPLEGKREERVSDLRGSQCRSSGSQGD